MSQTKESWVQSCREAVLVFGLHNDNLPPDAPYFYRYVCLKTMLAFQDVLQRIDLLNPDGGDVTLRREDVRDICWFLALTAWATGNYCMDQRSANN